MIEQVKTIARRIVERIKNEPVLLTYGIALALNGAALFGFDMSVEDVAKIDALVVPVLAVITRQVVTPVSKLRELPAEDIADELLG
jgi:hypothetical protein